MHQTRQLFDPRRLSKDCGRIFQNPDISKNIFRFPASPAINDTLSTYRPTSGIGSLNSAEIQCAISEIFTCERKRVRSVGKWRHRGRSQEDDHSLTFDPNEFGVREPNSAEIGLAVFEKRSYGRTHRQTDRQTPLLYIYRLTDRQTNRQKQTDIMQVRSYPCVQSHIILKVIL